MVTLFSNTPQKKFTADIEVKEYGKICVNKLVLSYDLISQRMCLFMCVSGWVLVLPTFEVKLKPSKSFFHVGDPSLTVVINAK